jgi:hypothetical protein
MEDVSLSVANVMAVLLDREKRRRLVAALRQESGGRLPLRNRYAEVAPRCLATPEQLRDAVRSILEEEEREEADLLVSELVFHREMPEDVLFGLLERKMCLSELGHRSGPRALLERLAAEHRYSEAITTLALDYYAADDVSAEDFARFVAQHRGDFMLAHHLRRATHLSEEKRRQALALVGEAA